MKYAIDNSNVQNSLEVLIISGHHGIVRSFLLDYLRDVPKLNFDSLGLSIEIATFSKWYIKLMIHEHSDEHLLKSIKFINRLTFYGLVDSKASRCNEINKLISVSREEFKEFLRNHNQELYNDFDVETKRNQSEFHKNSFVKSICYANSPIFFRI
jgi:hypothetical protein